MRLLKFGAGNKLSLTGDLTEDIPAYAILSHTWGPDEGEVTFDDLNSGKERYKAKAGYAKVRFCGKQALKDGLQHFWVDSCSINKASSAEHQEALNSMFRWYRDSAKCYVYLSDVSSRSDRSRPRQRPWDVAFRQSRWFRRGWTLQELLAPASVEFFSREGEFLGTKRTLEQQIHEITKIPLAALRGAPLVHFKESERMGWSANRVTKKKEDKAYCLLGIFNVFMPLIYGEGDNAFARLEEEIRKRSKIQPRAFLQPSDTIPFRRDRDFVEREILDDIWRFGAEPAARVALVGLGGVGKTQLAIEYAFRVREHCPDRWVFWVHASSAARFEQSFKIIAERVRLAGCDEPKADILGMVYRWLLDESNGPWTMVVDNADSPEVMFASQNGVIEAPKLRSRHSASSLSSSSAGRSLSFYLPSSSHGSILITSRSRSVAEGLIEYPEDILDVKPMDPATAEMLLQRKLKGGGSAATQEDFKQLVRQLDYMPLAISQAAAYINQRMPRVTVSMYLETLQLSDHERGKLLHRDIRDPRRDGHASNSILATWYISFEYLRQKRNSAARLLALMSQFDREGIPDHLLREKYGNQPHDLDDFEEDIATLRTYHLVDFGVHESMFDMHRLVQFATKEWLELHDELGRWQNRYIDILHEVFPRGVFENWATCQALFPHVEMLVGYQAESVDSPRQLANVLYRSAGYAWRSGRLLIAERMARMCLHCEEILPQHSQTLDVLSVIGLILREQGRYEEAAGIHRQVLAKREMALGPDHPDVMSSMNNLATVLRIQGKFEEAGEMHREVVTRRQKTFGLEHPDTLRSYNNLATALQDQGKNEEAEAIHRRNLTIRERILGVDHPDTLMSMNNFATTLRDQGKFAEAEVLHRRAVAHSTKVLGLDHPNTLMSMTNLAIILRYQNKYEEAETVHRQALARREKVLGMEHPDTLTGVFWLAMLLQDMNERREAVDLYQRAAEGLRRVRGAQHRETLSCEEYLADLVERMKVG